MSRWLLGSLLPHSILMSRGYRSLQRGTGIFTGLDVWPRNRVNRQFPDKKMWKNLDKPCKSWPAARWHWSALLRHLLCRLVMLCSLSPAARGTSVWTSLFDISLSSASYRYCHFTFPSSLLFLMQGDLGNLVLTTVSLICPHQPAASLNVGKATKSLVSKL